MLHPFICMYDFPVSPLTLLGHLKFYGHSSPIGGRLLG